MSGTRRRIEHRPLAQGPQTDAQIQRLFGRLEPRESLVISFIEGSHPGELTIDRRRQAAVTSVAEAREVLAQALPGREQEIKFEAIKGWEQLIALAND